MPNIVYIATSLDGYIADKDGSLDWLQAIPNPDNQDFGWSLFIDRIDALVMGRKTFETVCSFSGEWPYTKPVFVLSNSITEIPESYRDMAEIVSGSISEVVDALNAKGYSSLYIDGGKTIQSFLEADLIDELIITQIPILLGGGVPLYGQLTEPLAFEHISTTVYLKAMVQSHYQRNR